MADILHQSSSHLPSPSNNDGFGQLNHSPIISTAPIDLYDSNYCRRIQQEVESGEEEGGQDDFSVLALLLTVFRKSLVGCKNISGENCDRIMEIGWPTNVRHIAHVTFDRFNGFLGLPVEFEPEVPRRPPSASTRVFGVSTESMQLSDDPRGNCVPTILLMMQKRLYLQCGLQSEGIFRINSDNGQEEYAREQINNGAWFREIPSGILDSLPPEQVMEAQSEEECSRLVGFLPPTEAALQDWAFNLMADVAQFEHFNKMNARNIAMVFAPNMTKMSDPLTALMYAVQVMNFLKTLVVKMLREWGECVAEVGPVLQGEPSDEDGHHSTSRPRNHVEGNEDEEAEAVKEPPVDQIMSPTSQAESRICHGQTHGFLNSIENILSEGKGDNDHLPAEIPNSVGTTRDNGVERVNAAATTRKAHGRRAKSRQMSNPNEAKKGASKRAPRSALHCGGCAEKNKDLTVVSRVSSHKERVEAWR
ncbi:hypothetical protein SASPL_136077 [Salvia splendens]|uniref:Uncharacterized protein n=1 Tax=Salvia splendens TaxID=180675 RepID=A0A8X8ZH67_SALSN|nr:hypothetical protein SASPL_136077 [Salvia splendens]